MTVFRHAYDWAVMRDIDEAYEYADYYERHYPEGDYSHWIVYPEFLGRND
jgi:hypothetical protein